MSHQICVECLETSNCPAGYHCADFSCLLGDCADAADCPPERPYCDNVSAPSRCIQCRGEEDCANLPETAHCLLDEGICVQCLRNAHCPEDATCDAAAHQCLGGFASCSLCGDKHCQAGAVCAHFTGSDGTVVDAGCVRECLDSTDCNKGYHCEPSAAGAGGACLPLYDPDNGTCEAIRDLGVECRGDGECGVVNVNDGICAGAVQGLAGACTIRCRENADCPGELVCRSDPLSPNRYICATRL